MTQLAISGLVNGSLRNMNWASLRRSLRPGTRLRLVSSPSAPQQNTPRVVMRTTPTSIWFQGPNHRRGVSGTRLPLEGKRLYATDTGFELHWGEREVLRYEWVEAPMDGKSRGAA